MDNSGNEKSRALMRPRKRRRKKDIRNGWERTERNK